jgi:Xaa-Pro aminopeptidase
MQLDGLPARTIPDRLEQFRLRMSRKGLDAYWVVSSPNVRYLSGFTGDESTLVVTADRTVLVTDSRFAEQAGEEAEVSEVVVRNKPMARTVGLVCRRMGRPKVGFTASRVSYADGHSLAKTLPQRSVMPCSNGISEALRTRKGRGEVETITRATRLQEEAFQQFCEDLEVGRSEKWLAARLEWEMKRRGAEDEAFETICAVGERASLPHAVPTDRALGSDSPLLVDWGACVEGYHSDLTRVVGTGTMPQLIVKLSEVVFEAQEAAFEQMGPGVSCAQVDRAARRVIARAGYGSCFGHSLGHGVGLEVHETPRLAAGNDQILLPGMVVTVEPGIYVPGEGGVRIEDLVVITGTGFERISSLQRRPWSR